ncbi:MAG: mechanosensitive ion channel family protein [Prevotella sp.]|nr:mechanosensitive ion channel family protein [Prevotella sp.]MCM1075508.1 mechanosensitive ion channel family protein [Ruminococcus sp.]
MNTFSVLTNILCSAGATEKFDTTIKLPTIANESAHFISMLLMDIVKFICDVFGLEHNENIISLLYATLVIVIAIVLGGLIRSGILWIVRKIAEHAQYPLMRDLRKQSFFSKLCRIIPPLFMILLMQFALSSQDAIIYWIEKVIWIYILYCIALALNTLIFVIWQHIDERENKKKLPLKGFVQVIKAFNWIVVIIIAVAIIVNKSPATLLAGLGAFAAVLMLVFKDSILGVVAGVQLSENDMLRVGDWIKVDGTSANGTVIDVTLSSVKVLNWDKTITTVPPYSLISGSFQNYRSMQESGTRRICRTYYIDTDTVRFCSPDMLEEFKKITFMEEYINKKLAQKQAGKVEDVNNSEGLVDGTIDTNLGLFRAYMKMYLDANPHISKQDFCFVNTLQQTNGGIPLQIYCFTDTSAWVAYEAIQSSVFEHLTSVLPQFGLYAFENPSSRDSVNEGYLEASGNPANLYGLPYPFMPGVDGHPGTSPFSTKQ